MSTSYKKLGFIRFWQVYYLLALIIDILMLVFFVKSDSIFTPYDYYVFSKVILFGVLFMLIYQRKKITRYVVTVLFLVFFVIGLITQSLSFDFPEGSYNLAIFELIDLLCVIYFLTSRRVKAEFTESFSFSGNYSREYCKDQTEFYQPRTWAFWRSLIIYFCVFSIIGHWLEALYCTLIQLAGLPGICDPNSQIWSDWFYPFVVYGVGATICILFLHPLKVFLLRKTGKPLVALAISFLANALFCTALELVMGLLFNQPDAAGNLPLWDYRDMAFNFMGQICLQNGLAFGLIATLMVWVFYPLLERFLCEVSEDILQIAFVVIVVFFAILVAFYCINIFIFDLNDFLIE